MLKSYRSLLLAVAIMINGGIGAHAQQSNLSASATDPVLVFNRICYAQVPVLDNIRDMATRLAWEPMGGEDLEGFTQLESPDVLEGWDVRIAQKLYRLGIVQDNVGEGLKKAFPDFVDGKTTNCTLILDGTDNADAVLERMNILAGKKADSTNIPDNSQLTTTWTGGNEDFKVFLIYKSRNEKAELLSVTILARGDTG